MKVIPDYLAQAMASPAGPVKPQQPSSGWPVVYAKVTAVASSTGKEVSSAAFVYPIQICNLCLVDKRATCPDTSDKTILFNHCGLPQDNPVTCCPDKKYYACYKTP